MKLNQKHLGILPALAGLVALSCNLSAQNLIDTTYGVGAGSFELGTYAENFSTSLSDGPYGSMRLAGGSTTITGWTVASGGTDWISGTNWNITNGLRAIDLPAASGTGGISTSIPTLIGSVYTISFKTSEIVSPQTFVAVSVDGIGNITNYALPAVGGPPRAWNQSPFFTFTATSANSIVNFTAPAASLSYGAMIDDVVITGAAIPEPSSALLLSVGVLFGIRRRRADRA